MYILFDTDSLTMPEPSQVLPNSTDPSTGLQNTIFGSVTSTIRFCGTSSTIDENGNITVCLLQVLLKKFIICFSGRSPRAYGPYVCVCIILQRAFLGNRDKLNNESYNATTTQHSTTSKLARFLL